MQAPAQIPRRTVPLPGACVPSDALRRPWRLRFFRRRIIVSSIGVILILEKEKFVSDIQFIDFAHFSMDTDLSEIKIVKKSDGDFRICYDLFE
ncbi:MAG: hypothetical protein VW547_05970 [Alphaproteobacteria bacterium]